jgi:hypothetical protein
LFLFFFPDPFDFSFRGLLFLGIALHIISIAPTQCSCRQCVDIGV